MKPASVILNLVCSFTRVKLSMFFGTNLGTEVASRKPINHKNKWQTEWKFFYTKKKVMQSTLILGKAASIILQMMKPDCQCLLLNRTF